jgi:hypothetical protein
MTLQNLLPEIEKNARVGIGQTVTRRDQRQHDGERKQREQRKY